MNNKMILPSLWILLAIGCKENVNNTKIVQQSKSQVETVIVAKPDSISIVKNKKLIENELKEVLPDSTVNKLLILENNESLQKFYKDYKTISTIDRLRESPVVIFISKDKSQYLLAYQYEGNTKNNFSCFEIGYFENEKKLNQNSSYNVEDKIFETESKLSLGISLERLIEIKGNSYKTKNDKDESILTYRIDNYEKSSFLKKYNMPGYFMEFRLKNNKITKILFGFDYP
ncbi:hypothetical protein [Flavobacterium limi]|uniref:Lipoprotein n=1 Tax=Flavobacterium limi TaxID=2045105 RepID=A0ABQ1V0N3_9FLAO|nr:hypothetical protein [Flavobacterium limi]GGF30304.1 hypothetical protein GCM10011518_44440 [Flavobacterium limi]